MKLSINQEKGIITNKSGREIARIIEGKLFIAQKDFRRAIRGIRELCGNSLYIIIK